MLNQCLWCFHHGIATAIVHVLHSMNADATDRLKAATVHTHRRHLLSLLFSLAEGRRLNQSRHHKKGVKIITKAVKYHGAWVECIGETFSNFILLQRNQSSKNSTS